MKTTPVSVFLVSILSTHSALAESPQRKERQGSDSPRHPFMEAWKTADQNGDDSLSFAEFSSLPRLQAIPEEKRTQLFQRLDKDENSQLTLAEMQHMGPPKPDEPHHRKRLWELDTDKSGGITREEFSTGEMFSKLPAEKQQKLFDRLDTNKDGTISPEDRPERPGPRPDEGHPRNRPPEDKDAARRPILFPKLDGNNDGFLSFEEFAETPGVSRLGEDEQENAFEKIDANKDLKLTPGEMESFRPLDRNNDKGPRPDKPRKNPSLPAN